jgi:hypothetical protein
VPTAPFEWLVRAETELEQQFLIMLFRALGTVYGTPDGKPGWIDLSTGKVRFDDPDVSIPKLEPPDQG